MGTGSKATERVMGSSQLGKQPPRYTFFLNRYLDARFTKCPKCEGKMGQKKLPLVIHIDDGGMMVLNKTCRYCPACDLLIAHKDEIEALLASYFQRAAPEVVGNDYLVVGTVDRADWRRGTEGNVTPRDMIEVLHDFKDVVQFKPRCGWRPENP
jgi:hypothetical protein